MLTRSRAAVPTPLLEFTLETEKCRNNASKVLIPLRIIEEGLRVRRGGNLVAEGVHRLKNAGGAQSFHISQNSRHDQRCFLHILALCSAHTDVAPYLLQGGEFHGRGGVWYDSGTPHQVRQGVSGVRNQWSGECTYDTHFHTHTH